MRFKDFLLFETQAYLAQKVGDILAALQELRDDAQNMGSRDLTQYSMRIVNLIRRVLHSSWPKDERENLVVLQKAGVAIMKSIDEKKRFTRNNKCCFYTFRKISCRYGCANQQIDAY